MALFGQNMAQKSVFFDSDKATLNPQAQTILRELADSARKTPQYTLYLKGQTDADGSDAHNQNLSERRAASVRNYLIQQGISADKIVISTVDKSELTDNDKSEVAKRHHRRVDISTDLANKSIEISTAKSRSSTSLGWSISENDSAIGEPE